jgi:hypothetical protein
MANQKKTSGNARSGNARSGNGRVSSVDVVKRAKAQIEELTGRPVEGVLGLQRDDDDSGWIVMVELLELRRVPNSTDVLGSYAVSLDDRGELREYARTGRYHRAQVEEG